MVRRYHRIQELLMSLLLSSKFLSDLDYKYCQDPVDGDYKLTDLRTFLLVITNIKMTVAADF